MRKGKLGLVLCLYPILAFACVIVSQPLLCALIFAFVLLAERDEWTGRQTLQALILSAVTALVRELLVYGASLFPPYSGFFQMVSVALGALSALVYLAAIILSILAILRVMKDQEAGLPLLSGLAYKAYGKRKPQPMSGQYPRPMGRSLPMRRPTSSPLTLPSRGPINRPSRLYRLRTGLSSPAVLNSNRLAMYEPFGSEPGRRVFFPLFLIFP